MKKFVAILMIFVATFASAGVAGIVAVPVVDSERAAEAFLAHGPIAHYDGGFSFDRVLDSGQTEYVWGSCWLNADFEVIYLTMGVDYGSPVVIVDFDDESLAGLPTNTLGTVTRFYLGLSAYDDQDDHVGYASTEEINILMPGDPITVWLRPGWQQEFVTFDLPAGAVPEDIVLQIGDSRYYYDEYSHGFDVWYDPLSDLGYEIVNVRTGERYQSGQVDDPAPAGNSLISVKLIGGVEEMMYFDGEDTFYSQQESMDGSVERDGEMIPAKVYMARPQGLNFYVSTVEGLGIEFRAVTDSGEMVLVASNLESGDSWLYLPPGFEKVIVTITGDASQDFYVWAERF